MSTTDELDGPEGLSGVDPETYARIAAERRRRIVVGALEGQAPPLDLECLAATVAAAESGVDAVAKPPREVCWALHHHHLPLLDDLGVLEYDHETHRVTDHEAGAYLPLH